MNVKTIVYKRVHNLGNYNTEHCEMTAELEPSDDVIQSVIELKAQVEAALEIVKPQPVEKLKPQSVVANTTNATNFDNNPF